MRRRGGVAPPVTPHLEAFRELRTVHQCAAPPVTPHLEAFRELRMVQQCGAVGAHLHLRHREAVQSFNAAGDRTLVGF